MRIALIFSIICLALSGCSATGPTFTQETNAPSNKATVYVYRPWLEDNAAGYPAIFVQDQAQFALKNGGYGVIHLEPGKKTISAKGSPFFSHWYPEPASLTQHFKANQSYYIRVSPSLTSTLMIPVFSVSGDAQMAVVSAESALKEIAETKRVH